MGRSQTEPGVAQMVERVVWDHEAAGSKPVTRTMKAVFTAEKPQGAPLCGFEIYRKYVEWEKVCLTNL